MLFRFFIFLLALQLALPIESYARLGGAGSDNSSSSSSTSSSSSSSSSSDYSSNSSGGGGGGGAIVGVIFLLIIVGFIIYQAIDAQFLKPKRERKQRAAELEKCFVRDEVGMILEGKYFGKSSEVEFKKKVVIAFMELQEAWSEQKLDLTRRYLSDGMYLKLQSQIDMMKELNLFNRLSNIQMDKVRIANFYQQSDFLILEVEVGAFLREEYRSKKFKQLNSKKDESFTEYYTFIKKENANKDLYNCKACPNCGAPLNVGETDIVRCNSCGSIANSPEFDWILTEITQADKYQKGVAAFHFPYEKLSENVRSYDLCKQYLEDIASNAFVHLRMAQATNHFDKTARFLTPEYLTTCKAPKDEPYLYYRFFLSEFDLKDIKLNQKTNCYDAEFYFREYYRRVKVKGNKLEFMDDQLFYNNRSVVMSKHKDAFANPYSVYLHQCSNCGGPIKNTTDLDCGFCQTPLNNAHADWVLSIVYKA